MSETYVIRPSSQARAWEVTKFSDYKEPDSISTVRITHKGDSYCSCMGFRNQKNKLEHKHIRLVKFWLENLDSEPGMALWFDGDDIEYRKFVEQFYDAGL